MSRPPPLPVTPIDLRRITVAELIESLTRGDAWGWKIMRQLVSTSALVSRRHARRHTPAAMPCVALPLPMPKKVP